MATSHRLTATTTMPIKDIPFMPAGDAMSKTMAADANKPVVAERVADAIEETAMACAPTDASEEGMRATDKALKNVSTTDESASGSIVDQVVNGKTNTASESKTPSLPSSSSNASRPKSHLSTVENTVKVVVKSNLIIEYVVREMKSGALTAKSKKLIKEAHHRAIALGSQDKDPLPYWFAEISKIPQLRGLVDIAVKRLLKDKCLELKKREIAVESLLSM